MAKRSEEAASEFIAAEKEREKNRKKSLKAKVHEGSTKEKFMVMLSQKPNTSKVDIPADWIDISSNIRSKIDLNSESFKGLIESIREVGLLQPPVVRKLGNSLELLSGHRRVEAWKALNHESPSIFGNITVLIRNVENEKREMAQLIENANRRNLDPLDTADAFRVVQETGGYQIKELAEILGRNADYVGRLLKIASWPEEFKNFLRSKENITLKALVDLAQTNSIHGSLDEMKRQFEGFINGKRAKSKTSKTSKVKKDSLDEETIKKIIEWNQNNSIPSRDRSKFKRLAETIFKLPESRRSLVSDFIDNIL